MQNNNEARRAIIAPSLLSGDFARLGEESRLLAEQGADWLHVDVMDGHFVPNMTLGPCVVASLRKATTLVLDCHLMITDPDIYGPQFAAAGADRITFHLEASAEPAKLAQRLSELGVKVGVAIKPGTPIDGTLDLIEWLDLILVMTVEPGFGGQSFMPDMMEKVARAASQAPSCVDIQVDGGLNPETTRIAARHGANVIVAGNAVFRSADRAATIARLRAAVELEASSAAGA